MRVKDFFWFVKCEVYKVGREWYFKKIYVFFLGVGVGVGIVIFGICRIVVFFKVYVVEERKVFI